MTEVRLRRRSLTERAAYFAKECRGPNGMQDERIAGVCSGLLFAVAQCLEDEAAEIERLRAALRKVVENTVPRPQQHFSGCDRMLGNMHTAHQRACTCGADEARAAIQHSACEKQGE
jgi:hypothetical protein